MPALSKLMELGYDQDDSKRALAATNSDFNEALDWLKRSKIPLKESILTDRTQTQSSSSFIDISESDGSIDVQMKDSQNPSEEVNKPADSADLASAIAKAMNSQEVNAKTTEDGPALKAVSYKCDECGKHLKDDDAVMFHAAKAKHVKFSESTEEMKKLTEEEKKQRNEHIQKVIAQVRANKEAQEKKESYEKEKERRMRGQEAAEMKREFQEKEAQKAAKYIKRMKAEKEEARRRVLEQIKMDRELRKESQNFEAMGTNPTTSEPKPLAASNLKDSKPSLESCEAKKPIFGGSKPLLGPECRIQVRLPNGTMMKENFKGNETLSAVRVWIDMNRKDEASDHFKYSLMSPFPKVIYNSDDSEKTLFELGLMPSASLVLKRCE